MLANNGDETFTNASLSSGTSVDSFCWGANFLDADNDKDLDLYVNSQYFGNNAFPTYAFFENSADGTFTQPSNVGFLNNNYRSYSSAVGDYNNDGFMEIVVNNDVDEVPSFWENIESNSNNYLSVQLEGNQSNRDGIGSLIEVSVNGDQQYRYTMCGEGYLSQNSSKEIFGLGDATIVDYVKVNWLSGIEDQFFNVAANQLLTIQEGESLSITNENKTNFSYYPNPVKNQLTIKATTNTIHQVTILNMLGQKVVDISPNELNSDLDLSGLQTGTYFVTVTIGNTTETIRVVKL